MVLIYTFILLEVVESLFWGDTLKIIHVSRSALTPNRVILIYTVT